MPSSTASSVDHRVTPPPECHARPINPNMTDSDCYAIKGWHWDGCPNGYTNACSQTKSSTSHSQSVWSWDKPVDGGTVYPNPYWATIATNFVQMICCPDILPYECGPVHRGSAACITAALSSETITLALPTGDASTTTLTPLEEVSGHSAIASFVEVHVHADDAPPASPTTTTTTWCNADDCADIPTSWVPNRPAATGERAFRVSPPPDMGKLGPLGIFAVTGFLGAVIFAGAVLGPWGWLYRQRRRQPLQAR
ncbi:hypothetical protein Cob_v010410 [Colletotrichum orbiculare MAFF 240422]|uniref:Uncharacterized protein n=1 Tax=Colletotrichum orbiculare (strain 104-T / ATCC 96160 / CBS 514.97 / LARS 414 / MAFF 240422) TaxID=1213857 RepID=A0A484FIR8_COLOR|nr:hypothetical protein Cob_v010410 [Colletotrichum orbiculare MAFF 240422]